MDQKCASTKRQKSADAKKHRQATANRGIFESAIGKMIVSFAHLEGALVRLICDLAVGIWDDEGLELRTLALVSGQPFQQLLARLSAQIHIAAPNHSKFQREMNSWIARAGRAAAARNRFVHQQLVFRKKATGSYLNIQHSARADGSASSVTRYWSDNRQ